MRSASVLELSDFEHSGDLFYDFYCPLFSATASPAVASFASVSAAEFDASVVSVPFGAFATGASDVFASHIEHQSSWALTLRPAYGVDSTEDTQDTEHAALLSLTLSSEVLMKSPSLL